MALWVFGYGSLMWRPGFEFEARSRARIHGLHRSLCIYSYVHRGTEERPGLVLGLDRGGSCVGTAYRVAQARRKEVMAYLRARELPTAVYLETRRRIQLLEGEGGEVEAVCYIADRTHEQYAGRLPIDTLAELVLNGRGSSGKNPEYLHNTVCHLHEVGIDARELAEVNRRVRARMYG